ncbi:hypothetical protein GA0061098_1002310 [Bradyrhizobium shewense]|uniref:Uncharacterized protein n=1 Tax=Bradyrhizobium shewense TaxID=1761772 RepID=A0A1C3UQX3_9BRAD|nr:hypothetical protein GA0061098_1002310 [Bradyrhizobium shewense]
MLRCRQIAERATVDLYHQPNLRDQAYLSGRLDATNKIGDVAGLPTGQITSPGTESNFHDQTSCFLKSSPSSRAAQVAIKSAPARFAARHNSGVVVFARASSFGAYFINRHSPESEKQRWTKSRRVPVSTRVEFALRMRVRRMRPYIRSTPRGRAETRTQAAIPGVHSGTMKVVERRSKYHVLHHANPKGKPPSSRDKAPRSDRVSSPPRNVS